MIVSSIAFVFSTSLLDSDSRYGLLFIWPFFTKKKTEHITNLFICPFLPQKKKKPNILLICPFLPRVKKTKHITNFPAHLQLRCCP